MRYSGLLMACLSLLWAALLNEHYNRTTKGSQRVIKAALNTISYYFNFILAQTVKNLLQLNRHHFCLRRMTDIPCIQGD